jgi:hypothetical protein
VVRRDGLADQETWGDLGIGRAFGDELHNLLVGRAETGPSVPGSAALPASTPRIARGIMPGEVASLGRGDFRAVTESVHWGGTSIVDDDLLEAKTPVVARLLAKALSGSQQA